MKKLFTILICVCAVVTLLLTSGCKSKGKKNLSLEVTNFNIEAIQSELTSMLNALPSTGDFALLYESTKELGTFYPDFLYPVSNISKMNTSLQKAFGMGLYAADGFYSLIFERLDKANESFGAFKELDKETGSNIESDEFAAQLDKGIAENIEKSDSIRLILRSRISNMHKSFTNNEDIEAYAATFIAGNIEVFYLIVESFYASPDNNDKLVTINTIKLRFSKLTDIVKLMDGHPAFAKIYKNMEPVSKLYEKGITEQNFKQFRKEVQHLRNSLI